MSHPDQPAPSDDRFETTSAWESELKSVRPRSASDRFADSLLQAAEAQSKVALAPKAQSMRLRRFAVAGIVGFGLCLLLLTVLTKSLRIGSDDASSPDISSQQGSPGATQPEKLATNSSEIQHTDDRDGAKRHRLPSLANYHAVGRQSREGLDDLLAQHARELLPPTLNDLELNTLRPVDPLEKSN